MSLDRARRPGPTVRTRVHELTADARAAPRGPAGDRGAAGDPAGLAGRAGAAGLGDDAHARATTSSSRPAGWCTRGWPTPAPIHGVAYCTDADLTPEQEFNVVTVTLVGPPAARPRPPARRPSSGSSACGVCGKDSVADGARRAGGAPLDRRAALPRRSYAGCPDLLRERQPVFDRTGGVHAAGLATADGELLVVREDVGRHNAVDKVTGARVLAGAPPAEACLVVSGRAGFELVQKAVAAGIGSLVAVGAPTSPVGAAGRASPGWCSTASPRRRPRCVRYA